MLQRMARINMDWSELKLEKVGPIFTSFNVLKSSESNEGHFSAPFCHRYSFGGSLLSGSPCYFPMAKTCTPHGHLKNKIAKNEKGILFEKR